MPKKRFSAEQIVVHAPSDRSVDVAGEGSAGGVPGSWDFAAELLSLAEGVRRA